MKRPIIPILLFFFLGIMISENLDISFLNKAFFVFFAFLYLLFTKKRAHGILLVVLLSSLILTDIQNTRINSLKETSVSDEYLVETVQEEKYGKSFYVKSVKERFFRYKLRVFGDAVFAPGDIIHVKGDLVLPQGNTNSGLFNYKNYLKSKKIYALIDTDPHNVKKIGVTKNIPLKIKYDILKKAEMIFEKNFEENDSNFLKTVFLGQDRIDDKEMGKIRALGIAHLLAISGFHISILYGFIQFILSKLNLSNKVNLAIIILLLWGYAFLLSWIPSVFRAVFMITAILIASRNYLPWDRKNLLFISLGINLFLNPFSIYDLGLQFSYMAAFIIITLVPRAGLKDNNDLASMIKFTLIIYALMLPLQLYYFNELQLGFVLGNIAVVPIFVIVVLAASLYMLLSFVPLLNMGLVHIVKWSLDGLQLVMDGASSFASSVAIPSSSITEIIFIYLLLFFIIYHRKYLLKYKNILLISLLVVVYYDSMISAIYRPIQIKVIDIGQGDSILIRDRKNTILIDTGGSFWEEDRSGEYILKPFILKQGISSIDYVLLSHFDEDHAGNIAMIVKEFHPKAIIGRAGGEGKLREKYNIDIPYIELKNSSLLFENFKFQHFFAGPFKDENNNSLVIQLIVHNFKMLFTGDIEEEAEKRYSKMEIESDIIKIPHHGSKTSSSEAFLDKVNPQISVLSVGRNNTYGFPHKEVLDRYENRAIPIMRTDENGEIDILIHRFGLYADTYMSKKTHERFILSVLIWSGVFYRLLLFERKKDELYRWCKKN